MLHSTALWLRLASLRLRRRDPQAEAVQQLPVSAGQVIWVQIGAEGAAETAAGAIVVLERLARLRPLMRVMVALPDGFEAELPEGVDRAPTLEDSPGAAKAMLRHLQPGLIVLFGNDLPAALIVAGLRAGVRVVMADVQISPLAPKRGGFGRLGQRSLLRRMSRILVRDQASLAPLVQLGVAPAQLEVGGVLGDPPEPLRCSEAERTSFATLTRTRPVWFAAAVPEAELPAVVAAQERAQRHAHRMLLILAPDSPDTATELAGRLEEDGWAVASRSFEGEPEAETEIFIADEPGEYGLWYRVAPVSYMGGTLSGAAGHARSPFEAAALGSAVLHGPQTAPYGADYARLDDARAARSIHDQTSLGEAVADLMSPDRAAVLAHNAWAVSSGGAAAADAVVQAILREFDAGQGGGQGGGRDTGRGGETG